MQCRLQEKAGIASRIQGRSSLRQIVVVQAFQTKRPCALARSTQYQPEAFRLRLGRSLACQATNDSSNSTPNKEFGYSRKDVILIGVGLIALGYAMYYGLQVCVL
jgi:hypothetical protein